MQLLKTFFLSECDSDWFMIPTELREQWNKMSNYDFDDQDKCDEFEETFSQYRTGGGIDHIEFTPTTTEQ